MASVKDYPPLMPGSMEAAQRFDKAVFNLGLDADLVSWAYDRMLKHHVLLLITDFFDQCGPLEISRALFKAYGSSEFPQEIDPFTIRLHSSSQTAAKLLLEAADNASTGWSTYESDDVLILGDDIAIDIRWIVSRHSHKRNAVEVLRRWKRFTANVEQLAA